MRLAYLTLAAVVLAGAGAQAGEDGDRRASSEPNGRPAILTNSRSLKASLDRIASGSRLWRHAVETVRRRARRVVVVTADQVVVTEPSGREGYQAFDRTVLAEVTPIVLENGEVRVVLVVVNLELLESAHQARGTTRDQFEADLDRIIVHEVFGHAFPYLLLGNLSGRCSDPQPGQPASDACSIRRENAVRAELRLGRRTEYGLESLALARAF